MRPPGIEQTYEIYLGLFTADGGVGIESLLKEAGTLRVHPLMQRVLELQRQGAMSVAELGELVGRWDAFRRDMLCFMSNYDALLCPVCSFAWMEHGSTYDQLPCFSYTMAFNLTGWPAAVVRGGTTRKGLPIGVQIVARPWREDVALAVAQLLQDALGGWQRPPL
jgi:amidase